ncbi:phosphopentomutase [Lujinxingia litoralis]|uniref:Phosphopentomutase n=1 Tax=Lujinxingia litoralis TaxID=2211119 RepID=A0A328C4Z5_9DELT|nr:phosphopentomutase [Lujinxingia litoralis]RAL20876.1 phosphopentomutase [Lujinxingia litoralis]
MTQSPSPDKRAVLIVLDSVGAGELPDADKYGDVGSHTLGHIAETIADFDLPNLRALGLGNIEGIPQIAPVEAPTATFGRMAEKAHGKDTATGHWEFVGIIPDKPFRTFPEGFDDEIIQEFIEKTGVPGVLGNRAASGTVIIEELGQEHIQTGKPIVYTSADPVFQIAAHEDVVPLETLYKWCEIAYDIVTPRGQSRVIARPFVGEFPEFKRTANRKDYTLPPPSETVLDRLQAAGVRTTGIGKIGNIYAHQGLSDELHSTSNDHGVELTLQCIADRKGLIFTNLVDFDALYGHRRNPRGYADALMTFDRQLPTLIEALDPGDLLIITADHGNDPTFPGTDHTREYVPLLIVEKGRPGSKDLGTRASFADIGATLAAYFGVDWHVGEAIDLS